tara:strand:+ start:234 stop:935 length:702 start_codon:yes stop_codon:yes gene_type:complete
MRTDYKKWHSSAGEDRWIAENVELPDFGVFVDIGAAAAKYRSNTYHFERNGWNGLCIDADPHWFSDCDGTCGEPKHCDSLTEHRKTPVQVAVGLENGTITFHQKHRHVLSSIGGLGKGKTIKEIEVEKKTINTILEEHSLTNIDLLSIDCEGNDFEIWESLDKEKHLVKVVIIEWIYKDKNEFQNKWKTLYPDYDLVFENSCNMIYTHKSVTPPKDTHYASREPYKSTTCYKK